MKTKIYLAILNQGEIRTEHARLISELREHPRYDVFFHFPCSKPISHNRNEIVQDFLKSDCDYLLQVDDDIIPPTDVLRLADYDKDVIAATCFAYKASHKSIIPLVLKKKKGEDKFSVIDMEKQTGVVQCDAVGTGCILVARRVLENVKAPFVDIFDEDGLRTRGLDLSFCMKAKRKGFKVWSHLDIVCSHWATMDLKTVYEGFNDGVWRTQPITS